MTRFRPFTRLRQIDRLDALEASTRDAMEAVAAVLPFRANPYVVERLIDWDRAPDDPMFRLTFPQPEMLERADLETMLDVIRGGSEAEIAAAAAPIRRRLNPHPADQLSRNVPTVAGERIEGLQHKYRQTVLFFPAPGQTCHAYCSYCFRWAQFVGDASLRFASREPEQLAGYVREHPEVTDVLLTGGDPMMMTSRVLGRYVDPLLSIPHVRTIRIGTKALAYWPDRFVGDPDADDTLRLFERVVASGRHLALMAHSSHPRELAPRLAKSAVARARSTGAVVRSQAPLLRGVNDDVETWRALWSAQVRLGIVPYYLFVARDTGARRVFEVPLARALSIFTEAQRGLSGLGRAARGPTMSCAPGKVVVDGVAEVGGEEVFVLRLHQARDPSLTGRPFFARFDPTAAWIDALTPALCGEAGGARWPWQQDRGAPGRPQSGSTSQSASSSSR